MADFKIPLAWNMTRLVTAAAAVAAPTAAYACPACGEPVRLRAGAIRRAHFAHRPSEQCNQETILHQTAKRLIQQVVQDWRAGAGVAPQVQRRCQVCSQPRLQSLPPKVMDAVLEQPLPGGYIADVALLAGPVIGAVVEIRVTHAVDAAKSAGLPVPFVELAGEEVIADPLVWHPLVDHFHPIICASCRRAYQQFQQQLARLAKPTGVVLPTAYYRATMARCWGCHRSILVFTWPGWGLHPTRAPRAAGRPHTVRQEYSATIRRRYWANTCPRCGRLQGDFPLYCEPDGAFFGFQCGADTPAAWQHDQHILAWFAASRQQPVRSGIVAPPAAEISRPKPPPAPDPFIDWKQLDYLRTESDLAQARAHQAATAAQVAALTAARAAAGGMPGPEERLARHAALLAARRVGELERQAQPEPAPVESDVAGESAQGML